jgi:hypothetical protein
MRFNHLQLSEFGASVTEFDARLSQKIEAVSFSL